MNPITVFAVAGLLTLVSSPASSQAQKPGAAQPAPAPAMKAQPKAAAPAAEMKAEKPAAPVATARKSRAAEDARECLQFSTNTEIIKCAEKYL
jgi:hypothetical protein